MQSLNTSQKRCKVTEIKNKQVSLPMPKCFSQVSLEEAISNRKSIRHFSTSPISLEHLSQLLWCCYGFSSPNYIRRSIPSAGAVYPMEIYFLSSKCGVVNLPDGLYKYNPKDNSATLLAEGDLSLVLYTACSAQDCVSSAPVNILICADYEKMRLRYGKRAKRYVHFEAGHAGQNIYLQAISLGLATVAVGAFDDESVIKALKLGKKVKPLYIFPIGKPASYITE